MPDVGMAEFQMSRQRRVILACEKWWPMIGANNHPNYADCSSFVKSVAKELGVTLEGNANQIHGAIQVAPWERLGTGDVAAHLAGVAATNGMFVIGTWRNPVGNGHVAVIVDTNYSSHSPGFRKQAIAYWGQLGGVGLKYERHHLSFGANKLPNVVYGACEISGR